MKMGLEIAALLEKMYPQNFDVSKTIVLLGNAETVQKLEDGASPADNSSPAKRGFHDGSFPDRTCAFP